MTMTRSSKLDAAEQL